MLGYLWLKKENLNIDWEKQTLEWRKTDTFIQLKIPTQTENQELVISYIKGTLTDQVREDWMKTRMSHSQLFTLEEEKAKIKPKEEIVPKEFHRFLNTVFSERPVGKLPPRMKYDHRIDLKPGFEPMRGAIYRQGPVHDKALRDFLLQKDSFNPQLPHKQLLSSSYQRRTDKLDLFKTTNTSTSGRSRTSILSRESIIYSGSKNCPNVWAHFKLSVAV